MSGDESNKGTRPVRIVVIVCTYQRPDDLLICLGSLCRQTVRNFRVIVVDGSDDDRTRALCEGPDSRARSVLGAVSLSYVASAKGLTHQRNCGIAHLTIEDDVAAFLDDDVELDPAYLERIAKEYACDAGRRIVGIGGNALNEHRRGRLDRWIRRMFLITDNVSGRVLRSGDAGHVFEPEEDREVDVLSGCNMTYRTFLFREHGLRFDEALTGYAYMEDQDFSLRAGCFGILRQLRDARLIHHVSPVSRLKCRSMFEMYLVNSWYLFRKNRNPARHDYLFYFWRIVGKLVQASAVAVAMHTVAPVAGWMSGMGRIMGIVTARENGKKEHGKQKN